jgi:mono/diheme cytochrome c family protein
MMRVGIVVLLAVVAAGIASAAEPSKEHPSKQVFDRYCASCHGIDGKGDGPAASALDPRPADLTMLAKSHGGEYPALEIAERTYGPKMPAAHGSPSMPVWGAFREHPGSRGTTIDIASLTNYIRSLQQK